MKTGSSVILVALAVADSSVLLIGLTDHFLYFGFTIWLEGMNKFICKSFRFVEGIVNYTAIYYLVIFTIFRVISVYLPHKNNVYCTGRRAFITVTVTFIIMCLINIDYLHIQYIPLFDENSTFIENDCLFQGKWAHYDRYHADYIVLCLESIVPFSILFIGNTMIIYQIHKFNIKRQEMTQTANRSTDDSQSMTAMLISISVLFLVTQTPFTITNLIEKRMNYDNYSLEYVAGFYLLETALRLLKFVNHAANFFCYCISGKRFKSELVAMVKGWFRIKDSLAERNSTVSTAISNKSNSRV